MDAYKRHKGDIEGSITDVPCIGTLQDRIRERLSKQSMRRDSKLQTIPYTKQRKIAQGAQEERALDEAEEAEQLARELGLDKKLGKAGWEDDLQKMSAATRQAADEDGLRVSRKSTGEERSQRSHGKSRRVS